MFDIRWIRENPETFDWGLGRRGLEPLSARLIEIDKRRRAAMTRAQEIKAERNQLSKLIGEAKKKGEDAADVMAKVAQGKEDEARAEETAKTASDELDALLSALPNLPADDVPAGADETANVELRTWGDKPMFDFKPRDHVELGETLGMMDFERAAKLSGARFVVLSGALARLERALASFMLDLHTGEFGYTEVNPPALVRDAALFGTGQLPKFERDLFSTSVLSEEKIKEVDIEALKNLMLDEGRKYTDPIAKAFKSFPKIKQDSIDTFVESLKPFLELYADHRVKLLREEISDRFWLIPTAEVPLTNLVANEILDEDELPKRVTAMTWCFRSEAGAAGQDTRGMIRQHQFTKVELVSIADPAESDAELERMTSCAEEVLKRLKLPYRVIVLCAGDMGFSARKTYDIEVWLPAQDRYREISSCSNCGDFQARRMRARYRPKDKKDTAFVHTLNGSALAVGRTLIAVLENYQQADGGIVVPDALRPYMGGLEVIKADGA